MDLWVFTHFINWLHQWQKKSFQQCNCIENFFYLNGIPLIWLCDKINQTYFLIICFIEFIADLLLKKVKVFLKRPDPRKKFHRWEDPKLQHQQQPEASLFRQLGGPFSLILLLKLKEKRITECWQMISTLRELCVVYPEWKKLAKLA